MLKVLKINKYEILYQMSIINQNFSFKWYYSIVNLFVQGHCIRMHSDEPINRFVLYESKVRPSIRPGAPTETTNFVSPSTRWQSARSNRKMEDSCTQTWVEQSTAVSKKKKPKDLSSELEWWWWFNRTKQHLINDLKYKKYDKLILAIFI